jgi:hypothetical protein
MSDNRTRKECLQDIDDARARLKQLIANDVWVYGIKSTRKGSTRYHTRVRGMGWRPRATDLDHSALWLTASRLRAEETMDAMVKDHPCGVLEIFRIAKDALPHLACWGSYKHLKTFGGTP